MSTQEQEMFLFRHVHCLQQKTGYSLVDQKETNISVCKNFFQKTVGVGSTRLSRLLKCWKHESVLVVRKNKRGKYRRTYTQGGCKWIFQLDHKLQKNNQSLLQKERQRKIGKIL